MKTVKLLCGAALLTLAASCAQDEVELNRINTSNAIAYKVDAGKMSRSATSYENGTDISTLNVSAWVKASGVKVPEFTAPVKGNTMYFLNDVLSRDITATGGTKGTFNYTSDARYWPMNGESLDFFSLVDNDKFTNGTFGFTAQDGKPGLAGTIPQLPLAQMPDMLYATNFDQTLNKSNTTQKQQNVSFNFHHAFAKVVINAEVRNENLRLEIYDVAIGGIADGGQFTLPYIDENGVEQKASWNTKTERGGKTYRYYPTEIDSLMTVFDEGSNKVVLGKKNVEGNAGKTKAQLVGNGVDENKDLLVIPHSYKSRNTAGQIKTYIRLKVKAYNIAGNEFDEDCDALVFPKRPEGSELNYAAIEPDYIYIPVSFNWEPGTINTYNLVFDCGNGGGTVINPNPDPVDPDDPDPNDPDPENPNDPDPDDPNNPDKPAFIKIGFTVDVAKWVNGENVNQEYPKK